MSKRRRLSRAARDRLSLEQGGVCCVPGCGEAEGLIEEHSTPHAFTGALADQLMCKACHDKKTHGSHGDIAKIAKAKRLRDDKTQHGKRKARGFSFMRSARKLLGRGFDKSRRKKMDGSVVKV